MSAPSKYFLAGAARAVPIMIAYILIGTACGLIGVNYGLSPLEILLLSALLYAGSAQFIFPTLYAGPGAALVATIFFVNLRHMLYSSALALQSRNIRTALRIWMGTQVTDESFLLASKHLDGKPIPHGMWLIGLQTASHISWIAGNMIGALFGASLDLTVIGIDFAATAMFIALLMPQLLIEHRKIAACFTALLASGFAIAFELIAPNPAAIILVSVAAATIATAIFGTTQSDRETAMELGKDPA